MRQFEPSIGPATNDDLGLPDALFIIADTLLIFDHRLAPAIVVANAFIDEHDSPEAAYQDACLRMQGIIETLNVELHVPPLNGLG